MKERDAAKKLRYKSKRPHLREREDAIIPQYEHVSPEELRQFNERINNVKG